MVTRESMKKWIIECLQERGGGAWPSVKFQSIYGTTTRLSLGFRVGDMLYYVAI